MILYEVNLSVDADIASRFEAWLETHIKELLALPGFQGADRFARKPEDEGLPADGRKLWTIHYRVVDRPALVRYFTRDAPAMRKQATDRFGEKFSITRRVLEPATP